MAYGMGWEDYLVLTPEDAWGVLDDTNTDLFFPFTAYDVKPTVTAIQTETFNGYRQARANRITGATLGGPLTAPLYCTHQGNKSLAEHIIAWALSGPASKFGDSWTGRLKDGSGDAKRHLGLRVASLTISGSEGGELTFSATLNGKLEEDESALPALDPTTPLPVSFLFSECQFFLQDNNNASEAGGEIFPSSFQITINNNHEVKKLNSHWPSVIAQGKRQISVNLGWLKDGDAYSDLLRASDVTSRSLRIKAVAPHLGTGASGDNTQMLLDFDRLNFANESYTRAMNNLKMEATDWISLKPDTSSSEMEASFSLT